MQGLGLCQSGIHIFISEEAIAQLLKQQWYQT